MNQFELSNGLRSPCVKVLAGLRLEMALWYREWLGGFGYDFEPGWWVLYLILRLVGHVEVG